MNGWRHPWRARERRLRRKYGITGPHIIFDTPVSHMTGVSIEPGCHRCGSRASSHRTSAPGPRA